MLNHFGDNFTSIINEAKPYRNIIKRYWTEEEVNFLSFYINII